MSRGLRIEWRSAALDRNSGLSWRAKLAGAVYCEFANADGVLVPGAERTRRSPRTLAVALHGRAHRGSSASLEQAARLTV